MFKSLQRSGALMIRPKLILAFAAMTAMTFAVGLIGLVFVDRIGTSVAVFSETTSPLLTESLELIDNARNMRSVVFHAIAVDHRSDQVRTELDRLHQANVGHLQRLRVLATEAGVDLKFDEVEQHEQDFLRLLVNMIGSHRRAQAASLAVRQRQADFDERLQQIHNVLLAVINRAEGEMNQREDESKVQVQTGAATVDSLADTLSRVLTETYPVLLNANKLTRDTDEVGDLVTLLQAQSAPETIAAMESNATTMFRRIGTVTRKLASRMQTAAAAPDADRIRQGLVNLQAIVLGAGGLFENQRNAQVAKAEIERGWVTVDHIDRIYVGVLGDVRQAVSRLNHDAREQATGGIAEARGVVAVSVLLATIVGLALAFIFSHRLTGPLRRLTEHAVAIRNSGEMRPLPDSSVTSRRDELGTLSRSFNAMIAELADARKRLIEWSEAEVQTQYERLNAAINNMPLGLCMFDADQRLIICNQRYANIYGLDPAHAEPGTSLRDVLTDHVAKGACPQNVDDYVEQRVAAVAERKPFYFVNELRDGHVIAISHQPMSNGGSVAVHEDITERRKVEAKIAYMAHHDALTDLPNRASFRIEMEQALHRVERGETFAVLCLDLDHFKAVNDTLGHPIGDALLQAVSDRIRDCIRPTDTIARLGGDEFAIVQSVAEQPVGATSLAERLIEDIGKPFDIHGHQVVIGTSVGIAIAPNDGSDADRLLKNADMALYRAKADGRSTFRFFESDMDAQMQTRRTLELELRAAVALGEFEVFYQPVMNLETRQIASFEALLRWRHPKRGIVLPQDFIPLSEEIGLINQIGSWVLKEACNEAMKWPANVTVAVNLSPLQFKAGTVVLDVAAALGASGLPASRLELEITETVLLQDTEATVSTLNQLRDLGVHISMDDFGTGYSSLGYLRKFPFDRIKIDRSFVRDLSEKSDSVAIVRAVAELGRTLGMATTAEGVETEEQLQRLREEGCTEVQGYLFSEPRPAHELPGLFRELSTAPKAVA